MATENALYTILKEKLEQDTLILPTLPEVALKVRSAADDPEISLHSISDIISHDPALSLGMIKVANSPLMGFNVKIETPAQAVTRIGMRQIKSIATTMAIKQMFVSKNAIVAMYMNKAWKKTIDIASAAISLADMYLMTHKRQCFNINNVTLAALIHNIGVLPILTEAENHQSVFANPTFLQHAIMQLSNKIGGEVTRRWGLTEDLTLVAESWSDLSILPKEVHPIDFIRAAAIYHNVFKNESTKIALLNNYTKKGILPDIEYMDSDEFKDKCAEVKSVFI